MKKTKKPTRRRRMGINDVDDGPSVLDEVTARLDFALALKRNGAEHPLSQATSADGMYIACLRKGLVASDGTLNHEKATSESAKQCLWLIARGYIVDSTGARIHFRHHRDYAIWQLKVPQ